jgi:hypothetical protein
VRGVEAAVLHHRVDRDEVKEGVWVDGSSTKSAS